MRQPKWFASFLHFQRWHRRDIAVIGPSSGYAFTFELAFSAEIAIGDTTVRDSVLDASGGGVSEARQAAGRQPAVGDHDQDRFLRDRGDTSWRRARPATGQARRERELGDDDMGSQAALRGKTRAPKRRRTRGWPSR